jgi:Excalibur calcium-binding domain
MKQWLLVLFLTSCSTSVIKESVVTETAPSQITISPDTRITLTPGQIRQFIVSIVGGTNKSVMWKVYKSSPYQELSNAFDTNNSFSTDQLGCWKVRAESKLNSLIVSNTTEISVGYTCTWDPIPTVNFDIQPGTLEHQFKGTANASRNTSGTDLDCADFSSQPEAQEFFLRGGGISDDRHNLDGDDDGIACEENEPWTNSGVGGPPKTPNPDVSPPSNNGLCWVNGYYRKNGTYVKGYWRKC